MKKVLFLLVVSVFFHAATSFAASATDVYEKLSKVDALFNESKIGRSELSNAYAEAKASEDSYSLNHKDNLVILFMQARLQYGAAKAELEGGDTNYITALNAARETMKKISKMIKK